MSVIFFLIGIGILVAGGFLAAFIWAVKSGQYDDDYTPSVRILFDDTKPENNDSDKKDNLANNTKHEINQSNNNTPPNNRDG
jgi:cbb3-type cytochrome oxidase maturation protein